MLVQGFQKGKEVLKKEIKTQDDIFLEKSKEIMEANKDLNWVDRALRPWLVKPTKDHKTHFTVTFSDNKGNYIVSPTVVQKEGDDFLTELNEDEAREYSKKYGINVGKDKAFAEYFSSVGYKYNFDKRDFDEAYDDYLGRNIYNLGVLPEVTIKAKQSGGTFGKPKQFNFIKYAKMKPVNNTEGKVYKDIPNMLPTATVEAKATPRGKAIMEYEKKFPFKPYKDEMLQQLYPDRFKRINQDRRDEYETKKENWVNVAVDVEKKIDDMYAKQQREAAGGGSFLTKDFSSVKSTPEQQESTIKFLGEQQKDWANKDLEEKIAYWGREVAINAIPEIAMLKYAKYASKANVALKMSSKDSKILNSLNNFNKADAVKTVASKEIGLSTKELQRELTKKNLDDLVYAKNYFSKNNYEIPNNLVKIAKDSKKTDELIKGLVDQHNTFVRGVRISNLSKEQLAILKKAGIDINNGKEIAEYMATHVPNHNYGGRFSIGDVSKDIDAIYTSNSIETAEGYTYGDGYIVTLKRPTDFSSKNRIDWIHDNKVDYFENEMKFIPTSKSEIEIELLNKIPNKKPVIYDDSDNFLKMINGLNNNKLSKETDDLVNKFKQLYKDEKKIQIKYKDDLFSLEESIKNKENATQEQIDKAIFNSENYYNLKDKITNSYFKDLDNIEDQYKHLINVKNNYLRIDNIPEKSILKTEFHPNLFEDIKNHLKTKSIKYNGKKITNNNVFKINEDITKKITTKFNNSEIDLLEKEFKTQNDKAYNLLKKLDIDNPDPIIESKLKDLQVSMDKLKIKRNSLEQVLNEKRSKMAKNMLNDIIDKNKIKRNHNPYAHYLHYGKRGEKIFDVVYSKHITPEIWKNHSRGHSGLYTKGLSAASIAGIGATTGLSQVQSKQQGGELSYKSDYKFDMHSYKKGGETDSVSSNKKDSDYKLFRPISVFNEKTIVPNNCNNLSGCAKYTEQELYNLTGKSIEPFLDDAWYQREFNIKAGEDLDIPKDQIELFTLDKGDIKDYYKDFQVGDYIELSRGSNDYINPEPSKVNPNFKSTGSEHVGIIVGFNQDGIPIIQHSYKGAKVAFKELLSNEVGKNKYKPVAVYRNPYLAKDNRSLKENYLNKINSKPIEDLTKSEINYLYNNDKDNYIKLYNSGKLMIQESNGDTLLAPQLKEVVIAGQEGIEVEVRY